MCLCVNQQSYLIKLDKSTLDILLVSLVNVYILMLRTQQFEKPRPLSQVVISKLSRPLSTIDDWLMIMMVRAKTAEEAGETSHGWDDKQNKPCVSTVSLLIKKDAKHWVADNYSVTS